MPVEYTAWLFEGIALSLEGMSCSVGERTEVTFTDDCVSACMEVIEEDLEEGRVVHAKRVFYLAVTGMIAAPGAGYGIASNWRCMAWFAAFNLLRYQCMCK